MSVIDWSKAPEWATRVLKSINIEGVECWADDGYRGLWITESKSKEFYIVNDLWYLLEVRPEAKKWSGDGLPPVGAICEAKFSMEKVGVDCYSEWLTIIPVYFGAEHVIYNCLGDEWSAWLDGAQFRPIRTPEKIKEDERESAVLCMLSHDAFGLRRRGLAEALYDAGYRKP